MQRTSPLTRAATLEKISDNNSGKLNTELVISSSAMSFFIHWLRRGENSVWTAWGLRYFAAPLLIIGSILDVILSIHQAYLRKDAHSISNAVVDILAAAAITVGAIAVIGSIAALSVAGPILLTAAFALKSAFNLCSAIGYAIHAVIEDAPLMKGVLWTKAKHALIDGLIGAVVTAAALTLMLVASPVAQIVMASLAVAATALAIVNFIYKSVKAKEELKAEAEAAFQKEFGNTTIEILHGFGAQPEHHHTHSIDTTEQDKSVSSETSSTLSNDEKSLDSEESDKAEFTPDDDDQAAKLTP